MFLKELIAKGVETISTLFPEREAREMVLMFLQHRLGTSRHTHILEPSYEVSAEAAAECLAAFDRMAAGEPIQYIIGKAYFYDREFNVTPSVLIPRPETELLVREALTWAQRNPRSGMRVADLCTGSGCIAVSLAKLISSAEVEAWDISDEALEVAQRNAKRNNVNVLFRKQNVLEAIPSTSCYDVIVSNPPYITEKEKVDMEANVLDWEPSIALFVPDSDPLLFYRKIAELGLEMLVSGGALYYEINRAYGAMMKSMLENMGYRYVELRKDMFGNDRMIKAIK